MRIFVLEDDPARLQWFRERLFDHDVTFADSVTQVKRYQPPYDLVCFDHDLGGRQLDAHEDNGEAFTKKVLEQIVKQDPQPFLVIHSYNPDGARNIHRVLERLSVFVAPFRGPTFNAVMTAVLNDGRAD